MHEHMVPALAHHPVFGDAAGILNRLYETYDFLLECVAPELWPPGADGHRIARDTAFDPTVRHRLDQALRRIRTTPPARPSWPLSRTTRARGQRVRSPTKETVRESVTGSRTRWHSCWSRACRPPATRT